MRALNRRDRGENAALEEDLRRALPLRGGIDSNAQVDALLNPRNVVIVGATDRPGNWAERVRRNLKRSTVRVVHPVWYAISA